MRTILVLAAFLLVAPCLALAEPPASCRDRFVGTWKYFGGSTVIRPDGTAIPSAGVKLQTWTCNGNQYIFSNPDGRTWTSTLSADGNKLVGAGTATRVSPRVAKAAPEPPKAEKKKRKAGKPQLVRGNRIPGFEDCASFKTDDKDYHTQARLFDQDPPHQWHVLVTATSNCKVPIVFNACFKFHTLKLPYQLGGGVHFLGRKNTVSVPYYSSGFPEDGSYSFNIRFCQQGKGLCRVDCP